MRFDRRHRAGLAATGAALLAWALLGGGFGCWSQPPPSCLTNPSLQIANSSLRSYDYLVSNHTVDARGVDWVGAEQDGVALEGDSDGDGCFVGGRIEGTFDPADLWDLFHSRSGLVVDLEDRPAIVEKLRIRNHGDGIGLQLATPCPNGSPSWLIVRDSLLEDIHDDAIESDGLCGVDVSNTLIDRAFVGFAFRSRAADPDRSGDGNTVYVRNSLVRLHSFPNNYQGQLEHNGFWKWAHGGKGPHIVVRNNRFLAFDAPPATTLFPFVNKISTCESNVLLFAGSEAEWQQALAGACDTQGDDGLCDGERMLALASCYTVITKPDTESEADFLATHWDPHVANWKATRSADDE